MSTIENRLHVALIVGTLGKGGAEKQLVYLIRALHRSGVIVQIYCLTQNEYYESVLHSKGFQPIFIGGCSNPLVRLSVIAKLLSKFHPHIIQSTHTYTNLYVGIVGRLLNCISIGAMRSSLEYLRSVNGWWTDLQLLTPTAIIANSHFSIGEISRNKRLSNINVHYLSNVIKLSEFDSSASMIIDRKKSSFITAISLGNLTKNKRVDNFLRAIQSAHNQAPNLKGLVVGDGLIKQDLEKLALELGIDRNIVAFIGKQDNIPVLLNRAGFLVLCSDMEGFPNVLLEAMASSIPVITTPAGDAGSIVLDGVTGFVVPFNDVELLAKRIVQFAQSPHLCQQMGIAGRERVESLYSYEKLGLNILNIYTEIAKAYKKNPLYDALLQRK